MSKDNEKPPTAPLTLASSTTMTLAEANAMEAIGGRKPRRKRSMGVEEVEKEQERRFGRSSSGRGKRAKRNVEEFETPASGSSSSESEEDDDDSDWSELDEDQVAEKKREVKERAAAAMWKKRSSPTGQGEDMDEVDEESSSEEDSSEMSSGVDGEGENKSVKKWRKSGVLGSIAAEAEAEVVNGTEGQALKEALAWLDGGSGTKSKKASMKEKKTGLPDALADLSQDMRDVPRLYIRRVVNERDGGLLSAADAAVPMLVTATGDGARADPLTEKRMKAADPFGGPVEISAEAIAEAEESGKAKARSVKSQLLAPTLSSLSSEADQDAFIAATSVLRGANRRLVLPPMSKALAMALSSKEPPSRVAKAIRELRGGGIKENGPKKIAKAWMRKRAQTAAGLIDVQRTGLPGVMQNKNERRGLARPKGAALRGMDMKTPERTPQVRREIAVLRSRATIAAIQDPKNRFKGGAARKSALRGKFEFGTMIGGATDHFDNLTNKERRKASSLVSSVLNDSALRKKTKEKFLGLQRASMAGTSGPRGAGKKYASRGRRGGGRGGRRR